jgi:hypothetical protein
MEHQPNAPDPAVPPPAVANVSAARWYGYEIMLSDAGTLGLAGALSGSSGGTAAVVGVIGFVGGAPIVHGLHGNTAMAVASPIDRVILPVVGALIGAGIESCSPGEWFCGLGGAMVGGGIGMAGAMVGDYSLAWQRPAVSVPPAPTSVDRTSVVSLTVAGVAPTTEGFRLVLGGRF